jgi:hypothetical protein
MTTGIRNTRLQSLRNLEAGQRGLLANARCLSEGVDVPALDGVAFIDPRRSQVDIIQAVGRAIRRSDDKSIGTIIIPVFISEGDDHEVVLSDSAFEPVWDILKALRTHDEDLAEQLDGMRTSLGRTGNAGRLPDKIVVDIRQTVSADFVEAFKVCLAESTTASWDFWFGLLQRFVEREGHAIVPIRHREAGFKLGSWVNHCRTQFSRGQFADDDDRFLRLNSLESWVWDLHQHKWDESYRRLLQFVAREGHAHPIAKHEEDGFCLGRWVSKQRMNREALTPERAQRLDDLPGWYWEPYKEHWHTMYRLLVQYTEREQHALVPIKHVVDGEKLGGWVVTQRTEYKNDVLPSERIRLLEALNKWTWNTQHSSWDKWIRLLTQFANREGHSSPKNDHLEDGEKLGKWLQRLRNRREVQSPERVQALEALPGWVWNTKDALWEMSFRQLVAYVKREGSADIKVAYRDPETGFTLGRWVDKQRTRFRAGKLPPDRYERLDELGVRW